MSESVEELIARMESAAQRSDLDEPGMWSCDEGRWICSDDGTFAQVDMVGCALHIATACPANVQRILDELRDTQAALERACTDTAYTAEDYKELARAEREKEQG